ncbi:hypothetical protein N5T50_26550 [Escherichia coli]|nr:hypothetical protein [Escherichia coli]
MDLGGTTMDCGLIRLSCI